MMECACSEYESFIIKNQMIKKLVFIKSLYEEFLRNTLKICDETLYFCDETSKFCDETLKFVRKLRHLSAIDLPFSFYLLLNVFAYFY